MRTSPLAPLLRLLLPALLPPVFAGAAGADSVLLTGGSRLEGTVLSQDEKEVRLLLSEGGELTLLAADVKEVARDADAPQSDQALRYVKGAAGKPSGLQTAVIHLLHPETGRRVDLVGAVHIADGAYYREVQRLLERADVVLYEMVKPKDAAPGAAPPEQTGGVRDLQAKLGEWLGLRFQLDEIEYDRPHFVHADLTAEEFLADPTSEQLVGKVKDMEPMLQMVQGLLGGLLGGKGEGSERMRRMLRGMLGPMLGSMGSKLATLLGGDLAELMLDKRNAACVARLKELPATTRTVAIFYGAAHLPDLEKRILALGYRRAGSRWLTAWDTSAPAPK